MRNNAEGEIKRRLWSSVSVDRRPAAVPCKAQAGRQAARDVCLARPHLMPWRFFVPEDGVGGARNNAESAINGRA